MQPCVLHATQGVLGKVPQSTAARAVSMQRFRVQASFDKCMSVDAYCKPLAPKTIRNECVNYVKYGLYQVKRNVVHANGSKYLLIYPNHKWNGFDYDKM